MEVLEELLKRRLAGTFREGAAPSSPGAEREPVCPLCGDTGWVGVDVPIDHPDFGRALPCQCRRAGREPERLHRYSNLGPLKRLTFERLIPSGVRPDAQSQRLFSRAMEAALAFARHPQGWLVLLGPSGSGKTHLAAAIANDLIEQDQRVFFVIVPDLLDHLRATFGPDSPVEYDDLFEQVRDAPVLVLDDLGAHSATPWAQEKLFQVLNHRFNRELPTIVTTIGPLEHVEEAMRTRLTDPGLSQVCRTGVEAASGRSALPWNDLPPKWREATFESFDLREATLPPEERDSLRYAWRAAQEYAKAPEGWLVLMGAQECGKTFLAAAIANELLKRGDTVLFVVVPDLLDYLRAAFDPNTPMAYDERFERFKSAPFLILDDLGAHSSTPWAREKLFQIVNYRYNMGLPLVVTTRLDPTNPPNRRDRSGEEMDPRLAARLWDLSISNLMHVSVRGFWDGRIAPRTDEARGDRPPRRRRPL